MLALLASSTSLFAQSAPSPPILNHQVAVFPDSIPNALCTTEEGHWLLIGEGGSMTFVQMWDDNAQRLFNGPDPAHAFEAAGGDKKVPIGTTGVVPARMVLDPSVDEIMEARDGEGGHWDRVYIAAGRSGLWAMEVSTDPTWNPTASASAWAWRIDDSGNLDPTSQTSRRWCSDVAVVTLEHPTTHQKSDWLVALFSRVDANRLRVYPLDAVRSRCVASAPETGQELGAALQISLGGRPIPVYQDPDHCEGPVASYGGSYAIGMSVDPWIDTAGCERADVIVALGHHGLARVRLKLNASGQVVGERQWGPAFGSRSHYYCSTTTQIPAGIPRELFGDVPYAHHAAHYAGRLERLECPVFTDAVVFRGVVDGQPVNHLYAAVDLLNWMVFDLGGDPEADSFDGEMPILHIEGTPRRYDSNAGPEWPRWVVDPGDCTQVVSSASEYGDGVTSAARDLEIASAGGVPKLVVTHGWLPYLRDYLTSTHEGHNYGTTADYFSTWDPIGSHARTFVYDIQQDWSLSTGPVSISDQGGQRVTAPKSQPSATELVAYVNVRVYRAGQSLCANDTMTNGVCQARFRLGLDPDPCGCQSTAAEWSRSTDHIRGKQVFSVAASIADPNLILTGINDGGLQSGGIYTLATQSGGEVTPVILPPDPSWTSHEIGLGLNGLLLYSEGQWMVGAPHDPITSFSPPAGTVSAQWMATGAAKQGSSLPDVHYAARVGLMAFQVHGPSGLDPELLEEYYFVMPKDRFEYRSRRHYQGVAGPGREFLEYIEDKAGQGIWTSGLRRWFVMASQIESSEGLMLLPVDELGAIGQTGTNADHDYDLVDQENLQAIHPTKLITHPEFNGFPDPAPSAPPSPPPSAPSWETAFQSTYTSHEIFTWPGILLRVNTSNTSTALPDVEWVLVVPCGRVNADPSWPAFDSASSFEVAHNVTVPGNPAWLPSSFYLDHLHDAFVQFWPVLPPSGDGNPETDRWRVLHVADPAHAADAPSGNSSLPKGFARSNMDPPGRPGHAHAVKGIRMTDSNGTVRSLCFVADWGGFVHAFDLTDILGTHDENDLEREYIATASWEAPQAMMDYLPNGVFDVDLEELQDGRVRIYACVRRVGIQVLIYDPAQGTFVEEELIQVPGYVYGADLSVGPEGKRRLEVTDHQGGVRIFMEAP